MKIAVTYENGQIFQHFGHTEQFKIYNVEDGKIVSSEIVATNGQGHGALASLLSSLGVDLLICGGIGGGAQMALIDADIELRGGLSGDCDEAVHNYLCGTLHHEHSGCCCGHDHHHDHDHDCGHDHHHDHDHDCGHEHHHHDHDCGHDHHHHHDHDCGHDHHHDHH